MRSAVVPTVGFAQ